MSAPITRRSLLSFIPAFGLTTLFADGAEPVVATPIMILFRQWEALEDAFGGASGREEAIYEAKRQIEDQILELPAQTAQDVYAQIATWSLHGTEAGFLPERGQTQGLAFWERFDAALA